MIRRDRQNNVQIRAITQKSSACTPGMAGAGNQEWLWPIQADQAMANVFILISLLQYKAVTIWTLLCESETHLTRLGSVGWSMSMLGVHINKQAEGGFKTGQN